MEHDLSRLVDAIPGLVWTTLPDGKMDFLNQRWCEYTGLSLTHACGFGWHAAIHPEDLAGLLETWVASITTGAPREAEARLRRFDGVYRWFQFSTAPLADELGRTVGWVGINTDIEDRKRETEERKRAEEQLRASEHRFRSIIDGLPANLMLMTPEGIFADGNRRMMEYFGTPFEVLRALPVDAKIHPHDRPELMRRWAHSIATGEDCDTEARFLRADGEYHWFRTLGVPLREDDGRIVMWHLLQTNIDDRKQAEVLIAGEKQVLEMVATGQPMAGILEALCGLVESTIGAGHCSIVLNDARAARLKHGAAPSLPDSFIRAIIGRPVTVESGPCAMAVHDRKPVIAPDLSVETRWADDWAPMAIAHGLRSCWSVPLLSSAGKALGAIAIYYDQPKSPTAADQAVIDQITHIASIAIERAQSDLALKRSEAFLAETRRLSSTGGLSKRMATGEITWSDEIYRMFEFDLGLPVTLDLILTRVHPDDVFTFQAMLEAQKLGQDYIHEYRLLMPDGAIKYLYVVASARRDEDGELEYIAAVQDVTPRRQSEEALTKARSDLARVARVSSLGALTASIAHEVNQPLSGIVTNAGTCMMMLDEEPPDINGARETARRTIRDGNRAAEVIARLRALFTKSESALEAIDLNLVAREVIALAMSELQRNRVVVRAELANDLPPIGGDRVQLQQVILNLLLNASDAMSAISDRARQVVVRTERDSGDGVRLSVQDAGAGFDPETANHLFDAFYTTKDGGMGIGLSVSRSIITSHGGRLWASRNKGPGVTFSFSIPPRSEGTAATSRQGVTATPAASDPGRDMSTSVSNR
jgi:PAS domain S-box-containing protein